MTPSSSEAPRDSAVRFFLSAALSPRVQAASRWTALNAKTRKSFSIAGKDGGSPFMRFLAAGQQGKNVAPFLDAADALGVHERLQGAGFLCWYRRLNFGYPFLDYSKPGTKKIDAGLMSAYAAAAAAPALVTNREGLSRRELAPGRLDSSPVRTQAPSEALLAGWLRAAAGILRVRDLDHSRAGFRTSPSGGARHPTDLGVRLSGDWPTGLTGSWWYDPFDHALTGPLPCDLPGPAEVAGPAAVFTVSSHVVRAMWRYRDARAFRPVIIDAGHLVQTLLSVVSSVGWTATWLPMAGWVDTEDSLDPVFGYVVCTMTGESVDVEDSAEALASAAGADMGQLRTTPFLSLRATPNCVLGENHFQSGPDVLLTPEMVDALAYATPSSRRDRPTRVDDLQEACGLSRAGVSQLVEAGLLLDSDTGDRLWRLTKTWSDHDWFLSLLVHAGEVARRSTHVRWELRKTARATQNLPQALDLRRTCRVFADELLPQGTVDSLLADVVLPTRGIRVLLTTGQRLGPLEPGTYLVREGECEFQSSRVPTDEEVSATAIGQPWARGFACIVWLIPNPAPGPGQWEAALAECGLTAQRITLAVCTDPRVGVFQSPALVDDKLGGLLEGHVSIDGAYMVGIGVAADHPKTPSGVRYTPSALFSGRGSEEL